MAEQFDLRILPGGTVRAEARGNEPSEEGAAPASAPTPNNGPTLQDDLIPVVHRADAADIVGTGDLHGQNAYGQTVPAWQLTPDCLVEHMGMVSKVRDLVTLGILRPDPARGGFQWTQEAFPEGQQRNDQAQMGQPQEEPAQREVLSDRTEAFFTDVTSRVGVVPARALVETIITGRSVEPYISDYAKQLGVEPNEFRESIGTAQAELVEQARKAVGFDEATFEQFSEWAWAEKSKEVRDAILRQVEYGDLRAVKKLAKEFHSTARTYDESAVLNADFGQSGIRAYRDERGKVILSIPGHGTMPYQAAIRAGIVKVSAK
jgi:hypothetical protein